ncbi:MAG: PQQ-binding-like beta-propeller repeat protein, partial [Chloroflexi bacterium]|nr:PQQ-binding-like beta-propeller repeat protein [Chloroflexota bacterium]
FFAVDEESGGGRVVALANADGQVIWQAAVESRPGGPAVFLADSIVVGLKSGHVHAFEAASGEKAWEFDVGHPLAAAPAFFGDLMIAGSTDGALVAFKMGAPSANGSPGGRRHWRGLAYLGDAVTYRMTPSRGRNDVNCQNTSLGRPSPSSFSDTRCPNGRSLTS